MTQNNIANPRSKPDSIGVGDWSFDEHMTGKYAVPTGNDGKYEVQLEVFEEKKLRLIDRRRRGNGANNWGGSADAATCA